MFFAAVLSLMYYAIMSLCQFWNHALYIIVISALRSTSVLETPLMNLNFIII